MNKDERSVAYQIEGTKFEVVYADITTVAADALVSSDDQVLSMSGGVSRAIRQACGAWLNEERSKHLPLQAGQVVVTSAGALSAKYLFHGVTMDYTRSQLADAETVTSIVRRCLNLAAALELTSIAFPALGTGSAQFPFREAAKTMTHAMAEFLRNDRQLERITLCLFADKRVKTSDLNIFYEQAVGLASIYAQSHQLEGLLGEVKSMLAETGRAELLAEVSKLQARVAQSNREIVAHASDNELFRERRSVDAGPSAVLGLSEGIHAFASFRPDPSSGDTPIELEKKLLQTRLSGCYTTLNIKQAQLNHYQIEEAKYGGQLVPPRLSFAIKELKAEIQALETEVSTIRQRQQALG